MLDRVSGPAWAEMLRNFRRSAWRWEAQGVYREPDEAEPFRRFLAGEPVDLSFMDGWLETVRKNIAAGKTYGRIRVLTEPLTDYLRFELDAVTELNIAAGEDVRIMTVSRARELDLPLDDFWLFDDETAATMHFGPDGFSHADVITGSAVDRFREIRDRAWQDAISFQEYLTNR